MGANVSTLTTPTNIEDNGVAVTLVLDKFGFCLGDIVQGTLAVCPVIEMNIACITMELVCQCQTELCEYTSGDDGGYYYFPYSVEPLHTQAIDVYDTRAQGGSVLTSRCSVPFTFPLPVADLPSTLKTVAGIQGHPVGVKYYFIIKAFTPQERTLFTVNRELKVFSACAYPDPEKPLMSYANVTSTLFCCYGPNKLVVYCTTNKTVYCHGDQVFLSYWYQTDKPDTLPQFLLSFEMKMHTRRIHPPGVHLSLGTPWPSEKSYTLVEHRVAKPAANTICQTSVTLSLDCGPEHSNELGVFTPLTWKYEFYLKIQLDRVCDSVVKVSLPIVINGKNAEQLAQMDRHLQGVALPAVTVAAQQFCINSAMSAVPSPPPAAAAEVTSITVDAAYASLSNSGVTGTTVVDDIHASKYSANGVTYVTVPVVE